MESWFIIIIIIIISLCIPALLKSLFNLLSPSSSPSKQKKLPPGPKEVPFIGNLLWLRKSILELESTLRELKLKYGPIITLKIGSRQVIFVSNRSLAHQALIQKGAIFSDRPSAKPTDIILGRNQQMITSATYGPTWRLLRRNLTSGILYPSRVKSYIGIRQWVLGILIRRLLSDSGSEVSVSVVDHFEYTMFCLLARMCFGDNINEKQIKEVKIIMRRTLLSLPRFNILNAWPAMGKIVFHKRWNELIQLRRKEEEVLMPLIKYRMKMKEEEEKSGKEECVVAYVDTLLDLHQTEEEEQRKLTNEEMVSLCVEFLEAGTDTTSTALQWTMANLVKYPQIQNKLYQEIIGVVGPPPSSSSSSKEQMMVALAVKEEYLQRMPYLKAVVLESLRRHPPSHFVLPHSVTEDVELGGYIVPKNTTVNFQVAEMAWDPKVWEDPMEFKPERFSGSNTDGKGKNEGFDITGNKEIKMMPFGVGRRICPGSSFAMLHLEYFVANLVWYFEWRAKEGDEVDLSEKQEFTVVMKHPLRAHISPRFKLHQQ